MTADTIVLKAFVEEQRGNIHDWASQQTRQMAATGAVCFAFRLSIISLDEFNQMFDEISAWQIPACGPSAAQSIATGQPAIATCTTQKPQAGM